MLLILSLILLVTEVTSQYSYHDSPHVQCYSCSDCPEPFFFIHAQITTTPPDIGQCMKTVVDIPATGRHLVSKGFTRNCIPEWSQNVRVYCCQHHLCNSNTILFPSSILLVATIFLLKLFSVHL